MSTQDQQRQALAIHFCDLAKEALTNLNRADVMSADIYTDELFNTDLSGWSGDALTPYVDIIKTKLDILKYFTSDAMKLLEKLSKDLEINLDQLRESAKAEGSED